MTTSFGWEGIGGYSVSGCTRDVQVKLRYPLRTRAIPERLRGVFTMRRYINPRLP